ncbi:MAG: hypothetical protein QOJ69_2287 [Actinomycetota bacterium]|jgi:hypothetical protein|nr:hypothetical protein [Actinomycetota bacterium]MEA2844616.1 hypothetical protein [Actinomycetota bacterium]
MVRRVLLAVVVALVAVSCGGSGDKTPPTTTPTTAAPTTTVAPASTLPPVTAPPGVPRTATTQITEMGPGEATLSGVVNGPEGPVTGATVKIERFVGTKVATQTVLTAAGVWTLPSILGGSYRVAVFRPPDLAQPAPDAFFLGAAETKQLTTTLVRYGSTGVTATIDPNPPLVGLPATLTVHYGGGAVDATGHVVASGQAGVRVQISPGPGLSVETAPVAFTDGTGAVSWVVRCLQPGPVPVNLLTATTSSAVSLPPCTVPPPGAP